MSVGLLLLFVWLVGACASFDRLAPQQPDISQILTAKAAVAQTQPAPALSVTPTTLMLPEVTFIPLSDKEPTMQITVAVPADAACMQASFVSDVTVPDGTRIAPGETILKTWRVRNTGSCAWSAGYRLVLVGGNYAEEVQALPIGGPVAPGAEVNLSVQLVSPGMAGEYRGEFQLATSQGDLFGFGVNRNGSIFFEIIVFQEADLELSIAGFHLCSQNYVTVQLINIGETAFTSAKVSVHDLYLDQTLAERVWPEDAFMTSKKACPPGTADAEPGGAYYLAINIGPVRSKHNSIFSVEACTEAELRGVCVHRTVGFLTP